MHIHHIGYLVKNIGGAVAEFSCLGYTGGEILKDDGRGVYICFLRKDGYQIELVSPYRKDSDVSGLMKKYKNSPYHICYELDKSVGENMSECMDVLCAGRYIQISERTPAPAIEGRNVVFLMGGETGMMEILE